MTAKKLHIKHAARYPIQQEYDTLNLSLGVNVIVGDLQAGKTTWLRMIDYVLGDPGKIEDAFDAVLAEKYERISVTLVIDGKDIVVERRWKEPGVKSKIIVDGDPKTASQFSAFILEQLAIPLIHIPSGNPYERSWIELSWRELFRHCYKQEKQWGGFAEKQPEVNRSACILHFLGVASSLYPEAFGDMVIKLKEKNKLEAQKEVFVGVMQDLAVDLVGQPDMTVAVTPDSVDNSQQRLKNRLASIAAEREKVLNNFGQRNSTLSAPAFDLAKGRINTLHMELGKAEGENNDTVRRHAELVAYSTTLAAELNRLARAKTGASIFADLKVTHCPACDQKVSDQPSSPDRCPVCGQVHLQIAGDDLVGTKRIEFEEQQVSEELEELTKLIGELDHEINAFSIQIAVLKQRINSETRAVTSAQSFAIRAIPPEIALLDQEAGQISEQLQQLDRIKRAIGSRVVMNSKISALEAEISALDAEIKRLTPSIDFGALGDLIADRMNDYLNMVNTDSLSRWKTGRVSAKLRQKDFELFLDGQRWTVKAGGTASYIIQIAYHFALLSLAKESNYNYPGLLIIDFPPHFAKANDLRESENYLLKPFVDLCARPDMTGSQIIVAGRAFDNLSGANIIHL